ncbi:MAG TPA: aldo/keto reductase [Candidatus Enterocloster faecavium]|uniref:Aldo/keto reductase n=1 Tax=Candidatus Enterocloster faecavium TaxID=2838560 RepID=A0A9D2L5C8_9FIRM|nr:aldo/keto reductase [Candidatus Enterocloster faecavium]
MEYRKLPKGSETISVLGLGNSSLGQAGEKEAQATVELAIENGINYFDMAAADAAPFPAYGNAVAGCRDKVYFQVHFGADYHTGTYGWTLDLDQIKRSVDWQMKNLKTDYIDFGFIHCIDEIGDLEKVVSSGILEYIKKLKAEGVVRHIGMSSHSPQTVQKALDLGLIEMLMFSINPGYDYRKGEYAIGSVDERMELYRRCEKEGVGISVMKAFSAGQLLDEKTSPFKKALTRYQCIQYALDKPAVVTVLPGVRNREDLKDLLGFFDASPEERDYSILGTFTPQEAEGICVYCNHCQPCPGGLDVGLINKYYDLARVGDELAGDHYAHLEKKAGDCIQCGHCDRRCPFHVNQTGRMKEIEQYFGA